jgi:hypothetical protein
MGKTMVESNLLYLGFKAFWKISYEIFVNFLINYSENHSDHKLYFV